MPKIDLSPIGSKISKNDGSFKENLKGITQLEDEIEKKKDEIKQGWGKKYQDRVAEKGKMTSWQRIEKISDDKKAIFPLNTFANYEKEFEVGKSVKKSPSAGVITVISKVENRYCIIVANDNTVASGSWWPKTPEKIIRAQQIALKLKLPVIYLVDCSGLFLPRQSETFPGMYGAGHIFKKNSELSAAGVPQIAGGTKIN